MNIGTQSQAVLLLTAWFGKREKDDPKPLSPTEWGRFAQWLKDKGTAPDALLSAADPVECLNGWTDRSVTPERVRYLLGRSGALGLAVEKWQRAGLWVMTRSDADYPARLKQRLKFEAPPVLFGCGNRQLLSQDGIAVVGSRDASDADLAYTARLGGEIAMQGYSVVSGGARGVDESAMQGALDQEGTVIGVLADRLLRAATSAKYRKGLMANNVVLVSPFNPEAGFDAGNAMARNKYIYCLAVLAIVVAASNNKGGTWAGAVENLSKGWVPLWVRPHKDSRSGNAALVERGARSLPDGNGVNIRRLIDEGPIHQGSSASAELFGPTGPGASGQPRIGESAAHPDYAADPRASSSLATAVASPSTVPSGSSSDSASLYDFFLRKLAEETAKTPRTPADLRERLGINKTQLNEWLKRALEEGKVRKLNRPVRYQVADSIQRSLNF
jgi:predicted Rossmann fold nucleotide-binding protein DprA/Smf involved in DNA uptake